MRINLLYMYENSLDVCSFFRGYGPLIEIRREMDIEIKAVDYSFGFNWKELAGIDLVYIQRPFLPQLTGVLERIKECHVPIWLDYDDLMTDIPLTNKYFKPENEDFLKRSQSAQFRINKAKMVSESFIKIIKYANVVSVSTQALKNQYAQYHDNIVVIRNALNDYKCSINRVIDENKYKNNIVWRGSDTHAADLFEFQNTIRSNALKYQDWNWSFMLYNPQFITDYLDQTRLSLYEPMPIMKYFNLLPTLSNSIFVVPLVPNDFNYCKSSNVAMEAAFAGCAALVPDWPEWEWCHDDFKYKNVNEFNSILIRILERKIDFKSAASHNWNQIKDKFLLSKINRERIALIKSTIC